MGQNKIFVLNEMYNKLYADMEKKKKLKNKSIILSFINLKSTVRYELLLNSSIDEDKIKDVVEELRDEKLIHPIGDAGKYSLSMKGVWAIEEKKGNIDIEKLMSELDRKFFLFDEPSRLNDKEKVILFSLIASRAFSEESAIDLMKEGIVDYMGKVLEESLDFLKNLKIVSSSYSSKKLYGQTKTEHPVSGVLRHTDRLPKKTKSIFKVKRPQKYYLNIYDGKFRKKD